MKFKNKIYAIAFLLSPVSALAACDIYAPYDGIVYNIDLDEQIIVQRDAPVNSQVFVKRIPLSTTGSKANWLVCKAAPGSLAGTFGGSYIPGSDKLAPTNVPGISLKIKIVRTGSILDGQLPMNSVAQKNVLYSMFASDYFEVSLIKTGVVSAGKITNGNIANVSEDGSVFMSWNIAGGGNIVPVACAVTSTAIQVNMNEAGERDFSGAGSTAGETDFKIDLDCDASTNVNLTVDAGSSGAADAAAGILNLDGTSGVAQDVGLQILSAGSPVEFGKKLAIGTTPTDGPYSVPLKAQYIQTGSKVVAGTANANATFTMTYQ